ncbi:MAG: hypothetical protein Q9159_003813 [Coniocarpon cinnabarinum]
MGNDGGSIPTRRELVKEAARNPTTSQLKATTLEHLAHAWRTCALSGETLKQPVVGDALGRLFNKEEIIKAILPAEDAEDEEDVTKKEKDDCLKKAQIKGLKDVVALQFESEGAEGQDHRQRWICPITKKELGEATKAVYLVPCGHVFAEAAVKELGEERCPTCSEKYAPNDQIPILPMDETDLARLMLRMNTLKERSLTHALKKAKKSKKNTDVAADADGASKHKTKSKAASNGIQNAATASLTAKVLEEQSARDKKRKADMSDNLDSLYVKKNARTKEGGNNDFMSRGYSIPTDSR